MVGRRRSGRLVLALLALCACLGAMAQDNVRIGKLTNTDKDYMEQQRAIVQDLAERNLGRGINGDRERDLESLQWLLDRRLVRPNQTRELQAMGVIMGDLLAADLDMHWVIYEDRLGRSRALRYRDTKEYLFPITMISRRQEADNNSTVSAIYQKARDIIVQSRPPLPFQ